MTPPLWQQAFVQWVRACVAAYDTPAPTHPATTPVAHVVRVILADQRDAPRPTNPNGGVAYCAIRFMAERSLGSVETVIAASGDDATITLRDRRAGTVSVSIFGPRCEDMADALGCSTEDDDLTAALAAQGIALGAQLGRTTVGVASGDVPDPRVVIDYSYHRSADLTRPVGTITHPQLSYQPLDADGDADGPPLDLSLTLEV